MLIQALTLAKVLEHLITAIKNMTKSWFMKLQLDGENDSITSDLIEIKKGTHQGDSLSVILFVLSLNTLSHLSQRTKGYIYRENCR